MKNNNAFYIAHKGHTNVTSEVHEIKLGQFIYYYILSAQHKAKKMLSITMRQSLPSRKTSRATLSTRHVLAGGTPGFRRSCDCLSAPKVFVFSSVAPSKWYDSTQTRPRPIRSTSFLIQYALTTLLFDTSLNTKQIKINQSINKQIAFLLSLRLIYASQNDRWPAWHFYNGEHHHISVGNPALTIHSAAYALCIRFLCALVIFNNTQYKINWGGGGRPINVTDAVVKAKGLPSPVGKKEFRGANK
jgi:hypothetical protein